MNLIEIYRVNIWGAVEDIYAYMGTVVVARMHKGAPYGQRVDSIILNLDR